MILNLPGQPAVGTPEHALLVTHGRHRAVQTAMAWLAFSHLPDARQSLSRPLYLAAMDLLGRIKNDTPDLTDAMKKLVEAKDCYVRAGILSDQSVFGRPVQRPGAESELHREWERVDPEGVASLRRSAEVVDPPTDWAKTARDLTSGNQALIDEHLPHFCRPTEDVELPETPIRHYGDPEA
jgi:hypothetical protein